MRKSRVSLNTSTIDLTRNEEKDNGLEYDKDQQRQPRESEF